MNTNMIRNNKGFTLIELLAVIVILAVVAVIGTTTVLPYMENARKDAFLIEATNVVKAAKDAVSLYNIGEINFDTNHPEKSCQKNDTYCFSVSELIDLKIYSGSKDAYSGKVIVDLSASAANPVTLYLKKNEEFKIIESHLESYKGDSGYSILSSGDWNSTNSQCSCS